MEIEEELKSNGIEVIEKLDDETIKSQLPKAGIKIKQGSTVYVDK